MISARGNSLWHSDLGWLASLQAGTLIILIATALRVLLTVSLWVIPDTVYTPSGTSWHAQPNWMDLILACGFTVVGAASIVGYWLLTKAEPGRIPSTNTLLVRRGIRIASIVSAGCSVAAAFSGPVVRSRYPFFWVDPVSGGLVTASWGAWVVLLGLASHHCSRLFARMSLDVERRNAAKYRWLLPCLAVAGAIVLMLGPLFASIMYIVMMSDLLRGLSKVARSAPRNAKQGGEAGATSAGASL